MNLGSGPMSECSLQVNSETMRNPGSFVREKEKGNEDGFEALQSSKIVFFLFPSLLFRGSRWNRSIQIAKARITISCLSTDADLSGQRTNRASDFPFSFSLSSSLSSFSPDPRPSFNRPPPNFSQPPPVASFNNSGPPPPLGIYRPPPGFNPSVPPPNFNQPPPGFGQPPPQQQNYNQYQPPPPGAGGYGGPPRPLGMHR